MSKPIMVTNDENYLTPNTLSGVSFGLLKPEFYLQFQMPNQDNLLCVN
jgi:hypothetical protein